MVSSQGTLPGQQSTPPLFWNATELPGLSMNDSDHTAKGRRETRNYFNIYYQICVQ